MTNRSKGFVLVTAMILLVIMTLVAIIGIQRATTDEKLAGNMREHNLAFQAAEAALRYCQRDLEISGPNSRLPLPVGTVQTLHGIPINAYPPVTSLTTTSPMPQLWNDKANWVAGKSYVLPANTIPNVSDQPACMIEEWRFPPDLKNKIFYAYLITARAVGGGTKAVVWLQATIRPPPDK